MCRVATLENYSVGFLARRRRLRPRPSRPAPRMARVAGSGAGVLIFISNSPAWPFTKPSIPGDVSPKPPAEPENTPSDVNSPVTPTVPVALAVLKTHRVHCARGSRVAAAQLPKALWRGLAVPPLFGSVLATSSIQ